MKKIASALCLAALLPACACALEFTPFYGSEQKRDDNIYLSENAPKQAWVNVSSAGFSAAHAKDGLALDARYAASLVSYSVDKGENDYVGHDAAVSFGLRRSTASYFNFSEGYLVTTDPAESELTQRLKRRQNTVRASFGVPLGYFLGAFAQAGVRTQDYFASANSYMDRSEYFLRAGAYYEFIDDVRVFAAYEQGLIRYPDQTDGDASYNQPALGVEGVLLPGVTVYAEANVQRRAYSHSRTVGAYTADDDSWQAGGRLELRWAPNPDTAVHVLVSRGNRESAQALSCYYVSTLTELGMSQTLAGRLALDTGVGLEFMNSPEVTPTTGSKRRTDEFYARAGLSYRFGRALALGVSYLARERSSNEDGLGFSNQVCAFSVKGSF